MVDVVTMSATTAAYASQAVKPSQRTSGDSAIEEAITLLDVETPARAELSPRKVARLRTASPSLMFMSTHDHLPQGTAGQAISRYLENSPETAPAEEPSVHEDDPTRSDLLDDMFTDIPAPR
ncbi:hypothetical protein [Pararhizobium sp.]|uniref:hypothetical protein n=1 Tax=Pararhizobium sp. TaxID=1977563 RepID=UPI002721D7D1|nr:hypothetical protein [Pararhizobium sp.]MDO9418859.1 hypothetical protein [Pararhizobium sp.]